MQDDVLKRLIAFADALSSIRAMILTSTRALPAAADELSDYDVILAVTDPEGFLSSAAWTRDLGRPAASWGDEHDVYGMRTFFRGVVYNDGTKIDYTIWPTALVDCISTVDTLPPDLDVGYRVIVDKDGRTSEWAAPTYQAHIPSRPTATQYRALVEEFWWSSTYVAKALSRKEMFFAKFILDDLRHDPLRRMLEWLVELDREWSLKSGAYGRGLERYLPIEIWNQLTATYVGVGIQENWEAFFTMADVFRRAATEVGKALGYDYPGETDAAIVHYLQKVRATPRPD